MQRPPANPLATRDDVQAAFRALEAPLLANWNPDASAPDLDDYRGWYDARAARLERVARYLWGLIPYTAGGGQSAGWTHVLDAIVHGTDPQHPDYWGPAGDTDQRSVEMAAFGLALRLVPDRIWNPLSGEQKTRFATWLNGCVDRGLVPSNWQYFRLLVGMGLRHVDRAPANLEKQEAESVARIDSYALDRGWYADGKGGQRDYYIPMAFHFYGPVLAKFAESGPVTQRAADWLARAKTFADTFVDWFAADGAALPFGRSLAYRFAQGAFWGGCGIAGVDAFTPGELRGLLLRHLRWWWKQPFLNADGTMSLGYSYPNLNILEPYNAGGSPYWAMKAFAPLMLPATDPFWAEPEAPMPARPATSTQPEPGFLIQRDPDAGHVVALSAGQWHPGWPLRHRDAKYAKLTYSTFFGPCVGANHEWPDGSGIDGTLLVLAEGGHWIARGQTTNHQITDTAVASDWSPFKGVTIRSCLAPLDAGWHVRVHWVDTDRPIELIEGGFAVNDARAGVVTPAVGTDGGQSGIVDLFGRRNAELRRLEPNSSLYFSWTLVPMLPTKLDRPGRHVLVTAVFGAAAGSKADWSKPPTLQEFGHGGFQITHGSRTVQIAAPTTRPS